MSKDPIGTALSLANRLAGSPWLDRWGLRKFTYRVAYTGTRAGFTALDRGSRAFRALRPGSGPVRLPSREGKDLFDLNLDDEQQLIVDSLNRFAREVIRPAAAQADTGDRVPEAVASALAELGLPLYAVPEKLGGTAQQQETLTGALIAEQLAQGDMAIANVALAPYRVARALTLWGSAGQQARYLTAFTEDSPPLATLAIEEPRPLFDPGTLHTQAFRNGKGYELRGLKSGVVCGEKADLFLVAAELDGNGPGLFLVERGTPGLGWRLEPAMGLRAAGLGQLALEGVQVPPEALLGEDEAADYRGFLDQNLLLNCALAAGAAQAVLDYVIPYCNERQAFGEPISHRQAVAFMISDLAIETDSMRLLLWRAASRADQGLEYRRETRLAHRLCAEKSMEIGSTGVQLLGGHGFIKEHPVERWYRDLRSTAIRFS